MAVFLLSVWNKGSSWVSDWSCAEMTRPYSNRCPLCVLLRCGLQLHWSSMGKIWSKIAGWVAEVQPLAFLFLFLFLSLTDKHTDTHTETAPSMKETQLSLAATARLCQSESARAHRRLKITECLSQREINMMDGCSAGGWLFLNTPWRDLEDADQSVWHW